MKFFKLGLILLLTVFSMASYATSLATKIERVGCHITNSICFVNVESPIPGDCIHKSAKQFRWNSEAISNHDALYSSLLAAQATGRSVFFGSAGLICEGAYPTFTWFTIEAD